MPPGACVGVPRAHGPLSWHSPSSPACQAGTHSRHSHWPTQQTGRHITREALHTGGSEANHAGGARSRVPPTPCCTGHPRANPLPPHDRYPMWYLMWRERVSHLGISLHMVGIPSPPHDMTAPYPKHAPALPRQHSSSSRGRSSRALQQTPWSSSQYPQRSGQRYFGIQH